LINLKIRDGVSGVLIRFKRVGWRCLHVIINNLCGGQVMLQLSKPLGNLSGGF